MSLPDQIRQSVAAGHFTRASRQFEQHTGNLCAAIRAGACGSAAIEETRRLLDWCRVMALAHRAHLADRRRELQARAYVAGAYR